MARISKDFIVNRLIPAVRIEEFLGGFLQLKRRGNLFSCCCPFHNEKTPSFFITPSRGMYHCFGCGKHGDVISFLMEYKNETFTEAVEELAEYAGLEIEYDSAGGSAVSSDRYAQYYELMDRVAQYFVKCLGQSREGQEYWYEKRELTRDTVLKARLGYAPNDYNYLKNDVARTPEEQKMLIDLGIMNVSQNNPHHAFPMFRGRVMIPILNQKGRVISFGGRALGDEKPKYLNTKETPIFRKRSELFGLYEALQEHRSRPPQLVIVEGYMDVIALRQAGITWAVASLGTSTTAEHFKMMFRYTSKVYCCYDGDAAGQHAAWHALETLSPILDAGNEVRFAFLPEEHDPDSLVREQGQGGFMRFLDASLSFPEFLVKHQQEGFDLADPGDRARFLAAALPVIKNVASLPLRNACVESLGKLMTMDNDRVYEMLNAVESRQPQGSEASLADKEKRFERDSAKILSTPMRRLMAFLLQQPTVVSLMYDRLQLDKLPALLKELGARGTSDLEYLLNLIHERQDITSAQFVEELRGTPREKAFNLLLNASFIPKKATGEDLPLEDRAEFFAKLIRQAVSAALAYQQQLIGLKGQEIDRTDLENAARIAKLQSGHS